MQNKVAIVTGAAGGIGAAVVHALRTRGVVVAAVDRNEVTLRETAAGAGVEAFPADVTSAESVESTVEAVEHALGPVDYLVNAAGVLRMGEARKLTDADWHDTFAVNTTGVFHMSRAVVNRMTQRQRGAIVTVASNAASTPRMSMSAYAASKAAATMFTKCLGLEVARDGIRCNLVAPGSTDTPMLSSMWHDETGPRTTVEGSLGAYRLGIPLGKIARPADIADAVVFLLSDQAAHITMHAMTVDGGATLGG
ncbi:2,3-dihydro-2,3-dihydroxybenzoate dehydrogenase [Kibdelosporangium phytohabitans]|uniref:2,3-dihydro-2,3-dihydroxybenzoate dehydrogenase n=1 Tax=Kibdelosporangium phytohabitans TaxID=860235 RepID=A0A0N9HWU5_9PSEU|nr:2,3-dihydro-2,3-dihydroxybenzoate dehydrogenase [Kibdelosporangium phytohabitans]ALG09736.1 2,3-dihydro-2,3-dihydroxybenzoate dehydrogenase [Kibdelosporangium phytohabitans]MBE1468896.1 2,3-dihydro-2,3-dihydroxybenzoate dehydrogenase [Kibdelosporangium phytohabitans]